MTDSLYAPHDPVLEKQLLDSLNLDFGWPLIERFSTLIRESGSEDERVAAEYLARQLSELGIPYQVHSPELFLSVPISASLGFDGSVVEAKACSFSSDTGPDGISGDFFYLPKEEPELREGMFSKSPGSDVRGKIAVIDGFVFPAAQSRFEKAGAIGLIAINPGERSHWGFCTPIWGAPDLNNMKQQPRIPIVSISNPDGKELLEKLKRGKTSGLLRTKMREGWFPCPVIVAEIEGQIEPERFVLAHGHLDSWHVGIGDNAVGNAAKLELARVFHQHRHTLARSLKIAWWTGHSTGRYAGSTWFADTFGLDLARNCIAQVNIDSPGCRWSTVYENIDWMSEAEGFCRQSIFDATGQEASGERPFQAGDYSFNNIGITSFFMLLSTMPQELVEEKGYYPVGGCGGNIAWHTEDDTIEIADRDNLLRDLRVYTVSLLRTLNNPLHPFDFRRTANEFRQVLAERAQTLSTLVDFADGLTALKALENALEKFYGHQPAMEEKPITDPSVRVMNDTILKLGRILIPINFTRRGRFRTEAAVDVPQLPDLAIDLDIAELGPYERGVVATHLRRGLNRVAWSFEEATEVIQGALLVLNN